MASSKNVKYPFDETGKLIGIVEQKKYYRPGTTVYEWRDQRQFQATMKFDGIHKAQYSDRMVVIDQETGDEYFVHMKDFLKMVMHMEFGVVTGTFEYARFNNKYGVKLVV